jgi:hypothetical protein
MQQAEVEMVPHESPGGAERRRGASTEAANGWRLFTLLGALALAGPYLFIHLFLW